MEKCLAAHRCFLTETRGSRACSRFRPSSSVIPKQCCQRSLWKACRSHDLRPHTERSHPVSFTDLHRLVSTLLGSFWVIDYWMDLLRNDRRPLDPARHSGQGCYPHHTRQAQRIVSSHCRLGLRCAAAHATAHVAAHGAPPFYVSPEPRHRRRRSGDIVVTIPVRSSMASFR